MHAGRVVLDRPLSELAEKAWETKKRVEDLVLDALRPPGETSLP
jgi:hypothetical protein